MDSLMPAGMDPATRPLPQADFTAPAASWRRAAVIVAHPDDEILWAGGLILSNPDCRWFIATLCRGCDPDRSPRFSRVLQSVGAEGAMADMDDGPAQDPLMIDSVQQTLLGLLPPRAFDLILTHAPEGEYTRHRRHEEVSRAVTDLWLDGTLAAPWLGLFAYSDERGTRLPEAVPYADRLSLLDGRVQREKDRLIREVYGFAPESWEARTSPRTEGFWFFDSPARFQVWLEKKEAD